ncbi:uncharacterized protein EDB91DRAFT_1060292 [Suillus paluster]|uniref:uncharacterized protein n=1 Tax=Suillus paluster TaxID=48578 RepID=UPI001B884745|nr:uncharacterized protein EDB91DRAFT_1060292 [Suillus paluster]KAG1728874.1 hypothetical protein EDB91DRAFT_1060292 [Suillus paluster]
MAKKKDNGVTIPEIVWTDDLVWQLLVQIELSENRVMLLGKRKKGENTSGDSKVMVYQRMAAAVFPQLHSQNAVAMGDQVHARRLRKTGEGIQSDVNSNVSDNEFFECYVPADGPNTTTTPKAQCIWDEIVEQFKFFPVLHQILSSCPNVTLIAITTGVGPHGRKTVHYQPPSDDEGPELASENFSQIQSLHTALQNEAAQHGISPSFESPFNNIIDPSDFSQPLYDVNDKENDPPPSSQSTPTPTTKRALKSSSMLQDSLTKARQRISKVPKKRTLDETLINMQKASLDAINARATAERKLQERQLLLKEFEARIWDVDEYHEKLRELMHDKAEPVKRARYSPDWPDFD